MKRRITLSVILVIIMLLSSVLVGCRADDGKDKGSETKEPSTSTDSKQPDESVTFTPGKYVRKDAEYFNCLELSENGTCTLTPTPPSSSMGAYHIKGTTKVEGNYMLLGDMRFEIVDAKTLKYVQSEALDSVDTTDIPEDPYLPYGSLFVLEEK